AGAFTVKIVDEERKTIGEGKILKGESKAIIKTKAISSNSQIFVTIKIKEGSVFVPNEPLVVADIKPEESFEVKIKNLAEEDIEFSWWVEEMKEF
ncbi:MAG TPA: hypothetical protein PLK35_04030, partial [Candidatus Moranbacteria bacterium]|nr:hypothetical protein [Candidatus Moranbacteria bacterium]